MSAVVTGPRARSTWLTGAFGLLILTAAVVMMVLAAPRVHAVRHESVPTDRLASWVWVTFDHSVWVTPHVSDRVSAPRPQLQHHS